MLSLPKRRFALLLSFQLIAMAGGAWADEPLKPWDENPWYWSYHGQPVLLLGASDDDNLFQWPAERLLPQLDKIVQAGGNVVRNTMSDRDADNGNLYPFKQLPSGKYDLDQWNQAYWDRFETFLRETSKRGIFVQIEVWDRFDLMGIRNNPWKSHPYNPANNVNYTFEQTGFKASYNSHPSQNEQPFYFAVPALRDNQAVLKYQQAFVNKMLDHSLAYDHVMYCMDNETTADQAWGKFWAEFIQQRARQEGKQVPTTEMWDDKDLSAPRHRQTFDFPQLYNYVDISQCNHKSGYQQWQAIQFAREYLHSEPRPMNATKIYGANGNKFGHNNQDAVERFWRLLLGGAASARFHRPTAGLGANEQSLACLRAARLVEKEVAFWELNPADELLVKTDKNEAYAAAKPGHAYVVYFTAGGTTKLDLSDAEGTFAVAWVSVDQGKLGPSTRLEGGKQVVLSPPAKGNWVAAITRP